MMLKETTLVGFCASFAKVFLWKSTRLVLCMTEDKSMFYAQSATVHNDRRHNEKACQVPGYNIVDYMTTATVGPQGSGCPSALQSTKH